MFGTAIAYKCHQCLLSRTCSGVLCIETVLFHVLWHCCCTYRKVTGLDAEDLLDLYNTFQGSKYEALDHGYA